MCTLAVLPPWVVPIFCLAHGLHEEFDTRVMLHAANAVSHGYQRILIIAKDTDIIVLGVSFFGDIGADKLWVSFGI